MNFIEAWRKSRFGQAIKNGDDPEGMCFYNNGDIKGYLHVLTQSAILSNDWKVIKQKQEYRGTMGELRRVNGKVPFSTHIPNEATVFIEWEN